MQYERSCSLSAAVRKNGLGKLVDLVGIEPTTSSMPWKRAPSCATGPLFGDTRGSSVRTAFIIVADMVRIVNATAVMVAGLD